MEEKTYNLAKICEPAVSQLDDFCKTHNLIGLVKADHVCITCSSREIYDARRAFYDTEGAFLYQSIISGRRTAFIGLKEVIPTSVGDIKYLEISDQKPDNSQVDRLGHIEIVPVGISYEELIRKLKESGTNIEEKVRPHHTTHDVTLPSGFVIRVEKEMLVDKIKRDELV